MTSCAVEIAQAWHLSILANLENEDKMDVQISKLTKFNISHYSIAKFYYKQLIDAY